MTSIRNRLTVILGIVVLAPAMMALLAIGVLAPRQKQRAADQSMAQAASAVAGSLRSRCLALGEAARLLALQTDGRNLPQAASSAISRQPGTFALLVRRGAVVTSAGADGLDAARLSTAELLNSSCSQASAVGAVPAQASGVPVQVEVVHALDANGRTLGTAVVGWVLDADRLRTLAAPLGLPPGAQLALSCPRGRGVTTIRSAGDGHAVQLRRAAGSGAGLRSVDGQRVAVSGSSSGQSCAVAAAVESAGLTSTQVPVFGLVAATLLVGLGLLMRLAASLTRPVLALTEAAERVARGDLSSRLPRGGRDELGRLSGAFNHMSDELELKLGELERSRDLLRQNVGRLGATLERTHDLEGLLGTVLGAAASATESQRATAWLVEGGSMVARASVPTAAPRGSVRRLPLGAFLAGEVAVDGRPRRLGHGHEDGTTALGGPALAAPLRRGTVTVGVIVVERDPTLPAYNSDDEAMLVSLAGPAGIAVDNVLLHREAQRLSVTDPLTGAGNLRYMTTTLAREVERATRFERPLAVLLLDLDHFKNVNDTFGHAVGDAVLREVARRLASSVREVDTVARYGGEEFVVVTPETDLVGAQRLAERICQAVRADLFVVGDEQVEVTVSVGIASLPSNGTASGELVRAAEEGLYAAKRAGRNCWRVAPDRTTHPAPLPVQGGTVPSTDG